MIEKSIASQAGAERLIYRYKKAVSASNCRHRFFFIITAPYILEYNEFRFPIYNPWYEQYICHVCDY